MKLTGSKAIFREKAGVISEGPIWVFTDTKGWLYLHESFFGLLWQVLTEWRHDRHLVGFLP